MKRQNVRAIFEAGKRAMRLFVRRWPMKNHRTRQRGIGYQRGEGVGGDDTMMAQAIGFS